MGVMLSLDRHRPAKGRRRQGQHVRHPDGQARARAAMRRSDPPASTRLLARLARKVVVRRSPPGAERGQPEEPGWPGGPQTRDAGAPAA